MFRTMGSRKTERKATVFSGNFEPKDDTSFNEGQSSVSNDTYSRVEQKENERSNAVNQPQTPLQPATPVVKPTPVVKAPEPSQADTNTMINAAKPITSAPIVPKVETTPKIQFMAPEPEPSKLGPNTGMTISSNVPGATGGKESPSVKISTYKDGEKPKEERSLVSNVYEDPNTGSTIATKTARENIADGDFYNVVASTNQTNPTMGASQIDPDGTTTNTITKAPIKTGDIIKSGPEYDDVGGAMANPYAEEQDRILTNTYNPRPSEDLGTGDTLQYSDRASTDAINPRVNTAVRRALLDLGKAGGQLRRFFIR